jgi:hypothetical protein
MKLEEMGEKGENYTVWNSMICSVQKVLFRRQSRTMRWKGLWHVGRKEGFDRTAERKRPFGRPRRGWEDKIT